MVAAIAFGDASLVDAVLDDVETAPIAEPLRATMRLLAALTLHPERFTVEHVDAVRAVGVSDAAIADAMYVCALFNMQVRLSDALGWEFPEGYDPGAYGGKLLDMGYAALVGRSREAAVSQAGSDGEQAAY